MLILHGENPVLSRNALGMLLNQAQQLHKQIVRLDAKHLEPKHLTEELGATNLFGEPVLIVIEELHSLPTSARKTQLIKLLGTFASAADPSLEIVLWEKRQLTPTMLKQLPGAKNQEFKLTKYLFNWLDGINGKYQFNRSLFTQAIAQDGEMMVFTMLIRQVRLLIQVKEGQTATLAPFMVGKLIRQAGTFTIPQLLQFHQRLFELDLAQKTSTDRLSIEQELELLLTGM